MSSKLFRFLNISIIFILLLAACSTQNAPASNSQSSQSNGKQPAKIETIKIGANLPLTGVLANSGVQGQRILQMAIDDVNAAGGIKSLGGAKLELVFADNQSNPTISQSETERLAQSGAVMLTGAYASGLTQTAILAAEQIGIPLINTTSVTNSFTESGYKWFFRLNSKNESMVPNVIKLWQFLNEKHNTGFKKVALLYEDGPYGSEQFKMFSKLLPENGFEVVYSEGYKAGSGDYSTIMNKVKAAGADLIMNSGYQLDTVGLLKAKDTLGYSAVLTGVGGSIDDVAIMKTGAMAEGSIGFGEWRPEISKAATEINDRYKKQYGVNLMSNWGSTYSLGWVMKEALERAGSTDPEALRKALLDLTISEGPAMMIADDVIDFDENGQNQVGGVGIQIQNGEYVIIWPDEYAKGQYMKK